MADRLQPVVGRPLRCPPVSPTSQYSFCYIIPSLWVWAWPSEMALTKRKSDGYHTHELVMKNCDLCLTNTLFSTAFSAYALWWEKLPWWKYSKLWSTTREKLILPTTMWAWKQILPQSTFKMTIAHPTTWLQPVKGHEVEDPNKLHCWLTNF